MVHTAHALASRSLLAADPHRPRYHFLPPSNWMNDPNGLIQWRGQYHLFYQHNPYGVVPKNIHWGHAVSDDLVHWRDMRLALAPTPGREDESGVWSGCAVDADGVATVVYTAMREQADGSRSQLPCLATSHDDDLRTWQKHPSNPVISSPPADLDVVGFRDHSVWRENGNWYQMIGSGVRGGGGTVLLYRSSDLVRWEYLGPLCFGDPEKTGTMWECPDLFRLGDRHMLVVSPIPLSKSIYFLGTYRQHRFTPEVEGVVDEGGCFYAPQSFTDYQGRRIMFGWLREDRDPAAQQAAGWAGVTSLPRVLLPDAEGGLRVEPAAELRSLRGRHTAVAETTLVPSSTTPLHLQGAALEIVADFLPSQAAEFGLKVRCAVDASEQTLIAFDPGRGWLSIDREHSSLDTTAQREPHGTDLPLADGEHLRLHVFVDHSVIEVYANGRACLTSRIYPSRSDSLGVELFARGGPAQLHQLDAWEMGSIWDSSA
jgi:beta-fructofuranosidase